VGNCLLGTSLLGSQSSSCNALTALEFALSCCVRDTETVPDNIPPGTASAALGILDYVPLTSNPMNRRADIEIRCAKASEEFIAASTMIHSDNQVRTRIAHLKGALDERREKARVWNQLDELIGSADGSKFRRFAQSLTFNQLIRLANRHLADLHPRYELQRAPGGDLVLQVIDHNMADEVRGVHNLSGGERFLVSLALALGLASMSSNRGITVESLFIDEGFGSLDSSSLAMAISALEQLQATGRRVGVVSHVDELKERIAVKVEVVPVGGGRCTVQVVTS
jgi:DNA repair protein SbcC/Rad50